MPFLIYADLTTLCPPSFSFVFICLCVLFPFSDGRMKASGIQYDDAIVEVVWSVERQTWKIERVRQDKHHGNHASTVKSIVESILDGVEVDQVR